MNSDTQTHKHPIEQKYARIQIHNAFQARLHHNVVLTFKAGIEESFKKHMVVLGVTATSQINGEKSCVKHILISEQTTLNVLIF